MKEAAEVGASFILKGSPHVLSCCVPFLCFGEPDRRPSPPHPTVPACLFLPDVFDFLFTETFQNQTLLDPQVLGLHRFLFFQNKVHT